jgi:ABC-type multidrug transport system fused ATPase/permease subunit
MTNFNKIYFLFSKKQKKILVILSIFIFFCLFLEMLSLAFIVPVFNIIFVEQSSWVNLFIADTEFLKSKNFKIIILTTLVLVFFIKNIFLIILNYFTLKFYSSIQLEISNKLFLQYLDQTEDIVLEKKSENLIRKIIGDSDGVKNYLVCYHNLFIELFFIFLLFLLLFFYNYKITIFFTLIFLIIISCYIKVIKKRINKWANDYQSSLGEIQNIVIEGIRGIKDIIIYNLEKFFFIYFDGFNKKKISNFYRLDFMNTVQRFWMEIFAIFGIVTPLIIYIYFNKSINELIPIFALFSASLFRILPSFNKIINHYNTIKFYQPSLDVVYAQFFNFNPSINSQKINHNLYFKDSFSLKNVTFFYNKNSFKVLNQVNLVFFKGKCSLILGENGSGKSTLLNIISGLIKPNEGKIFVDENISIYENKLSWLKKISYVQQNIFLLNKSIKENIVLNFDNKYDLASYNKIIKLLFLDQAFQNFPNKLDSVVGVDGMNISGGQRQLISIARALYKNGDIFLFDEPSSALDYDYQRILKQVINFLKENKKTIVIITHDITLFKEFADSIYKINSGNIIKQS